MNLIVDVGNTRIKFAVFNKGKLIHKVAFVQEEFLTVFKTIVKDFPKLKHAIISAVGQLNDSYQLYIEKHFNTILLNHTTKLPFVNTYKTPKTLGVDRIALASASVQQCPNTNALIIDAGSCITYDFVTKTNQYLGGAISPGIRMRYKALNHFTAKLPLLDTKVPDSIIGNTTNTSIHSGVVCGVVAEIDSIISHYKAQHQSLTVILTGGDAKFLSDQLKNTIFANPNFLLEGLDFILQYNLK